MTHCALLLGNDYHHIAGNGEATVLGKKEIRGKMGQGPIFRLTYS